MRNPTHSGVPLLWWTWTLAPTLQPALTVHVHVAEEHRPALYPDGEHLTRQSVADSLPPFLRRSGFQSPALTGAQVFALFPRGLEPSSFQHLVTAPDRPPRAQTVTGNGCPIARVDSCAVHFASDTGARKKQGHICPARDDYSFFSCSSNVFI